MTSILMWLGRESVLKVARTRIRGGSHSTPRWDSHRWNPIYYNGYNVFQWTYRYIQRKHGPRFILYEEIKYILLLVCSPDLLNLLVCFLDILVEHDLSVQQSILDLDQLHADKYKDRYLGLQPQSFLSNEFPDNYNRFSLGQILDFYPAWHLKY